MLSNIKTLIFFTVVGVIIAGCADVPSDAPVFPDFQSEMRIVNATRESALLMEPTGADPVITPYDTTVTIDRDTTIDTTIVTTTDTTWFVPPLDTTITPADTTIDAGPPPDTTITPADTTIVQPDSSIINIDFTHDTTIVATPDSLVTIEEFAVRIRTFKDLLVNTGALGVSVNGSSVATGLAYEGVVDYLKYPSGVYTITYTATTSKTADITVTDSIAIVNGEIEEDSTFGAVTVSTPATGVDATVSVSENVTLRADEQSLVILHDSDGGNRVSIYHEKFMSEKGTGSTKGLVKVINTWSAGEPVSVSLNDTVFVTHEIAFPLQVFDDLDDETIVENFFSGYAEIAVGASLTVTDGTDTEVATLTVTAGKRQTLLIFGSGTSFKLTNLLDK